MFISVESATGESNVVLNLDHLTAFGVRVVRGADPQDAISLIAFSCGVDKGVIRYAGTVTEQHIADALERFAYHSTTWTIVSTAEFSKELTELSA